MPGVQLSRLDTSSSQNVERLAELLRAHLPLPLPLLGMFYSGDLDGGYLSVWTTFDITTSSSIPDLFSVITFSPLAVDKYRFFCSAESNDGPATREEEMHVVSVINALYKALKVPGPLVEGIEIETVFLRLDGRTNILGIGHLHSKWTSCLEPFESFGYRTTIFHCPPQSSPVSPLPWNVCADDRFEVDELRESDIPFVNERCPYKRSHLSMLTRLPYSACLKLKGTPTPISWVLLYPDGSFGMLHVEPQHRKTGVARLVGLALCKKLEQMFQPVDEDKVGKYPWSRWEFADVVEGNEKGTFLMKSFETVGWREGWTTSTSYLNLEEGMEVVKIPWSEAVKTLWSF
ncbi:hypothetical protein QCA50_004884 [Cerrena zonata]|uniref:N-acetyltransferase domain-containing protein n=1 Tax=Cerrena zonata TaxID=2478898 RepID=A0AAW0GDV0_9APHY